MDLTADQEYQSYQRDVEYLQRIYGSGIPKKNVLKKTIESVERHFNPDYKAHFLFMTSTVLLDLNQKQAAYEVCINSEKFFPGTQFAGVAADRTKWLFVNGGEKFIPAPTFSLTVQVEPTNCCNIDCIMCSRNKKRKLGYMDFDTFKKVVDQSLSAGAVGIRLYHMGEPLIHKSILKFIEYFKLRVQELGFEPPFMPRGIGTQTNGIMLKDNLAKDLMGAGIDEISFSIDGRTPEEFEKI